MGKHLEKNIKYKITMHVLRGKSYADVSRLFDIPETTARDICKAYFSKCFLSSELSHLPENQRNLEGYRQLLRESII